jgi:hypothetical protein
MIVDIEQLKQEHKATWVEFLEKYGNATSVPSELVFIAGETMRAGYCIDVNPTTPVYDVFKHYSVDQRVWGRFMSEIPEDEKRVKRVDKYQSIIDWTQQHLFEQVTAQEVMTVGEISYPTALKFITDRPDLFRKIKRGLYELRDPKADRQAKTI